MDQEPQLRDPMVQSIGSLRELKGVVKKAELLDEKAAPVLVAAPIQGGESPYDRPFWKELSERRSSWKGHYYFTEAKDLGARGTMADEMTMMVPGGELLRCTEQVFTDSLRWGARTVFCIGSQTLTLSSMVNEKELVRVGDRRTSKEFLNLLYRIYLAVSRNKEYFLRVTRYFNQGPFNDIVGSIQQALLKRTGSVYLPDQRSLLRDLRLILPDGEKSKVTRIVLMVQGKFLHATEPGGWRVRTGTRQNPLGHFFGTVSINLHANTAIAHLGYQL